MNKQNNKTYTRPIIYVFHCCDTLLTKTSWGVEGDTGFGHKIIEGNPTTLIDAKESAFDNEEEDNTSKSRWDD